MADIKSNLTSCCKKLRLSASLAERAMVQEGSSNQEYLLNLLTEEIANRDAARLTRNLNSAGFPCRYTPEQYRTDEIDFPDGVEPHEKWTALYSLSDKCRIAGGQNSSKKRTEILL